MYSNKEMNDVIYRYTREMEIIKLRLKSIVNISDKFEYTQSAVEFAALQLRKIIEQIVLSSLITNYKEYLEYYHKLASVWNIKYIMKDIERINPNYYPVAALVGENAKNVFEGAGYATKDDIIDAYEKTSKVLHSQNPFAERIDYLGMLKYISSMYKKVVNLLNEHLMWPYNGDILFIRLHYDCTDSVEVRWYAKTDERYVEEDKA